MYFNLKTVNSFLAPLTKLKSKMFVLFFKQVLVSSESFTGKRVPNSNVVIAATLHQACQKLCGSIKSGEK